MIRVSVLRSPYGYDVYRSLVAPGVVGQYAGRMHLKGSRILGSFHVTVTRDLAVQLP